jgi:hypothetical protein
MFLVLADSAPARHARVPALAGVVSERFDPTDREQFPWRREQLVVWIGL